MGMKVTAGKEVELTYELFDAKGLPVEDTSEDGPIRYVHGSEEILPGLENALDGTEAGAELRVTLEADEAYGPYDPEGLISVPRSEIPPEPAPQVGDWIEVEIHAEDEEAGQDEGDTMEFRVAEVHDEELILDANHPLAGQAITFVVRVLSVEEVS